MLRRSLQTFIALLIISQSEQEGLRRWNGIASQNVESFKDSTDSATSLHLRSFRTVQLRALRGGAEWPANKTHCFNIKTGVWSVIQEDPQADLQAEDSAQGDGAVVKSEHIMTADQCMSAAEDAIAKGDWDEALSLLNVALEDKVEEFGKNSIECAEVYFKFATACVAWHNETSSYSSQSPHSTVISASGTGPMPEERDESNLQDSMESSDEEDLSMSDDSLLGEEMQNPLSAGWKVLKRVETILELELQRRHSQHRILGNQSMVDQGAVGGQSEMKPQLEASERKHLCMLADAKELLGQLALRGDAKTCQFAGLWPVDRKLIARDCFKHCLELRQQVLPADSLLIRNARRNLESLSGPTEATNHLR